MNSHTSRVLLISTIGLFGIVSSETQAATKLNIGANLCPPVKASYQKTVNDKLAKLSLKDLTARADRGNADAMVLLGLRYTPANQSADAGDTEPRPPVDMDKAMTLFRAAAAKKQGYAEFSLGVAYISGIGVPKDEAQAVEWFSRGARHGSVAAQYWLGEMTAKGRGGLKADWMAAMPYFKSAAEGGVPDAYVELGYMYARGYGGLPVDYEKSGFCYRQGVTFKSQIAEYSLNALLLAGHIQRQPGDPEAPSPKSNPDN